jgi:anti-anti-sigma regulatory factor
VLLDFTNVYRINSEEMGTLIGLHQRVKAAGGRLTLFNLDPDVYEAFTVTHLQTLLGICREAPGASAPGASRQDRRLHEEPRLR